MSDDDAHKPAGRTFQRPGAPVNVMTDLQQRAAAAAQTAEYVARKGEWVCCEAGHKVCQVASDIRYGDSWETNHWFTNWQQPEPPIGVVTAKCAMQGCEALWWDGTRGLHFGGGWR